jgi:long-chain fatty acid transport protein
MTDDRSGIVAAPPSHRHTRENGAVRIPSRNSQEIPVRTLTRLAMTMASVFACPVALATNGMNLEAWGATAGGMGGASFAHDSSNSALMNNPATLGLKPDQRSDFGIGLTLLNPDVASRHPLAGESASSGNLYVMPSVSWIRRSGKWTYGAGLLAQGGMGTEYGAGSSLFAGGIDSAGNPTALSGEEIRSEVGVGRVMFPIGYQVTDALSIAAQLDIVWATMDVKMDIDGRTFGLLLAGTPGVGRVSGSLLGAMPPATVNYARFDFSDDSDFNGRARGWGYAGKIGFVYKLNDRFSIGGSYHSKTAIDDLGADGATVKVGTSLGTQTMTGRITVVNFQWPETYGIGMAWKATPNLMLAGDIKHISWADAMKSFTLRFDTAAGSMNSVMEQNWKNQTVYMLGGQYMLTPDLALRAGINMASNPVPDGTLNPLFPAIVKNHATAGLGWRMRDGHNVAASMSYAPKVEQTNPNTGITSTHSQYTWRFNYNYSY